MTHFLQIEQWWTRSSFTTSHLKQYDMTVCSRIYYLCQQRFTCRQITIWVACDGLSSFMLPLLRSILSITTRRCISCSELNEYLRSERSDFLVDRLLLCSSLLLTSRRSRKKGERQARTLLYSNSILNYLCKEVWCHEC